MRLIISAYVPSTIVESIDAFNKQSLKEYSNIVFQIAQGSLINQEMSWPITCAAATMQSFYKSITKKLSFNKPTLQLACVCFGLLMCSRDLSECSHNFKTICVCFLASNNCDMLANARDLLKVAISDNRLAKLNEILDQFDYEPKPHFKIMTSGITQETEDDEMNDSNDFKAELAFTKYFFDIKNQVLASLSCSNSQSSSKNAFYHPKLVRHLLHEFMPFCFAWSGFVLRGLPLNRIECLLSEYNGYKKATDQLPCEYIVINAENVINQTKKYLEQHRNQ